MTTPQMVIVEAENETRADIIGILLLEQQPQQWDTYMRNTLDGLTTLDANEIRPDLVVVNCEGKGFTAENVEYMAEQKPLRSLLARGSVVIFCLELPADSGAVPLPSGVVIFSGTNTKTVQEILQERLPARKH